MNVGADRFEKYLRAKNIRFNVIENNSPKNSKYHSYKVQVDKDCVDIFGDNFWPFGAEVKIRPWRQKINNRYNSVKINDNNSINEAIAEDVWDVRPLYNNN